MITSYIVDGVHVLDEITGPNAQRAVDSLVCLTDWVGCKGILCTRREWLEPLEAESGCGNAEADVAIDEFLTAEPRISLERDIPWANFAMVDCMVGQVALPGGFEVGERFGLANCKIMDRAKRKKDMVGKIRFSQLNRDKFEKFFRKICWHSKTFNFFDKIWGEKAAGRNWGENAEGIRRTADEQRKSDRTRKRFADGYAYLIELILGSCVWSNNEINISINTVPCPNIISRTGNQGEYTEDRLMRSLINSMQDRMTRLAEMIKELSAEIDTKNKSFTKVETGSERSQEIEAKVKQLCLMKKTAVRYDEFITMCRGSRPSSIIHAKDDDEHDRFFSTDFHSYSFGRGFDILDGEAMRKHNVYWAEEADAE